MKALCIPYVKDFVSCNGGHHTKHFNFFFLSKTKTIAQRSSDHLLFQRLVASRAFHPKWWRNDRTTGVFSFSLSLSLASAFFSAWFFIVFILVCVDLFPFLCCRVCPWFFVWYSFFPSLYFFDFIRFSVYVWTDTETHYKTAISYCSRMWIFLNRFFFFITSSRFWTLTCFFLHKQDFRTNIFRFCTNEIHIII